jgi:Uma2 family endonuclease
MTTAAAPAMQTILAEQPIEIDLDALQGLWTEEQYLRLSEQTNRLIEFTSGVLEVLPMPNRKHQIILLWLYRALFALLEPRGGIVLVSAMPVRLQPGKFREPDVLLLLDRTDPRNQADFWRGADLVIEVVSPRNIKRDTRTKRTEYAQAGIPEYWIVNPLDETITVLTLRGAAYVEHGIFRRGGKATSLLLPDFSVGAADVFDAR